MSDHMHTVGEMNCGVSVMERACIAIERSAKAQESLASQMAELIAINQDLIAMLVDRYEEDQQDDVSPSANEAVLD